MINIIVAISENNAIGKDNQLLFRLKEDLKNFKRLTTDNVVIMGRKTYESIGKPLPNRVNLILSRQKENVDNIETFETLENAIDFSKQKYPDKEIFIIGGGQIYKQSLEKGIVDRMYITKVKKTISNADTYFTDIDYKNEWKIGDVERYCEDGLEYIIFDVVKNF